MGDNTKIEWTDATWNPITGCTKVSPGCAHCYAERLSVRYNRDFAPWIPRNAHWVVDIRNTLDTYLIPKGWRKPRKIFVCSMSDLFHELVPDDIIKNVWTTMELCPQHLFLILTKRPERMREWVNSLYGPGLQTAPLQNVWLGVSVENQLWAERRIPILLQTPAAKRFVSCEPLLGPVDLRPWLGSDCCFERREFGRCHCIWQGLDWVICGGESGPKARPMNLDWARSLRDQCLEAGVPYFLKQLGGWPDKRGGEKAVLDGRLWHEEP